MEEFCSALELNYAVGELMGEKRYLPVVAVQITQRPEGLLSPHLHQKEENFLTVLIHKI